MLKVLSSILCDLDPKVKALGQKAGICDGVPSTSALVRFYDIVNFLLKYFIKIHKNAKYTKNAYMKMG